MSMTSIEGFEYDWLACDADGSVAFFSTAGGGVAPAAFMADVEAFDRAIEALMAAAATTGAVVAPRVAEGLENPWRMAAERGLYAYDSDPAGGPYRRVAVPALPVQAGRLPQGIAEVAQRIRFRDRFASLEKIEPDCMP